MPIRKKNTTKKKSPSGSASCSRVKGHKRGGKKITTYARKKKK